MNQRTSMLSSFYRRILLFGILSIGSVCMLLSLSTKLDQRIELVRNWRKTLERSQQQQPSVNDAAEFYEKKLAAVRENKRAYSMNFGSSRQGQNKLPLILAWTSFFGTPMKELADQVMPFCPVQCNFSGDKSLADKADAIVFHTVNTDQGFLPPVRHPFQRYVFWVVESPMHSNELFELSNNFFNWTMTYRSDSDFINNYGELVIRNSTAVGERVVQHEWKYVENIAFNKTKMVAQFVSNCGAPSRRQEYVNELMKYISVDVFGICGTKECDRSVDKTCSALLTNDYRFYLAFENSVCLEYVTEKFWRMKELIVPIVLRGSDYKNIAPKGSYIAADDFSSPRDLATFLLKLADNKAEYLTYFEWTKDYWFLVDGGWHHFCEMCKALHDDSTPSKTYENMNNWWNVVGDCKDDFALRLLQSNNSKNS